MLPDHLANLQKDQILLNSIKFRHSNLYTHVMEVVILGDPNTTSYKAAIELIKAAMRKLTLLQYMPANRT